MAIDKEKYKVLYEYQKFQFEEERGHYFRLEDKAAKYLSFLTLSIPLYLFLFSNIISKIPIETNCILYFCLFFSILLSIACFCSAWSLIFRSMKLRDIPKLTSDQVLIDYFLDHDIATVFWDRAEKYGDAIKAYDLVNKEKIKLMRIAYKEIAFGSSFFMVFICLLLIIWGIYGK
ncbi:hypothetical protein KWF06_01545 [Acinetobacter baumannii]|uniref:hypothetical protein n=2 Tax=Acinetobacter pittii TaxID=48296 RepID=UPI00295447D8|nr:hypothetical protein [Acinetobacter pittii]MDV8151052.1 hypothetical protein [Acinetobacter pittii]